MPVFSSGHAVTENAEEKRKRAELIRRAEAQREMQLRKARISTPEFIEYALRNEQDESKLENAPFHREWQEHLEKHRYAVLIAPVEHAKSQQVAVGKTLHVLGQDPNKRLAIISNTAMMAEKVLRTIRTQIERNPRLREVFPNLRQSERDEDPWRQSAITVHRSSVARDPSIQALGIYGPLVGSRLDGVIMDDVLDFENTRTEEQRKKLIEWFDTTVITRMVRGSFIYAIGTPWHPDDFLHELEKRPGFESKRYSAVLNPDDPPARWVPLWKEQWDVARLLERRANMPEGHFARKYLCRVRLDDTSRFRQVWLDRMVLAGKGRTFLPTAPRLHVRGAALPCFTGVDLAVGTKETNDLTVLFTIALLPDGRRLVTEIESGRWQAPEIMDRIVSAHRRFGSQILVENNGAQQFIIDMLAGQVPVAGFRTGPGNKFSEQFGVESLAVEMRNGLWVMPSGKDGSAVHEEGRAFMNECLYYDPALHTGDRLMAAWIAREGLRQYAAPRSGRLDTQQR